MNIDPLWGGAVLLPSSVFLLYLLLPFLWHLGKFSKLEEAVGIHSPLPAAGRKAELEDSPRQELRLPFTV